MPLFLTRRRRSSPSLQQLTASTTLAGVMVAAMPLAVDYLVRPGDTVSEIAARHDTSVRRLVRANDLHPSGNRIVAGQLLRIPGTRASTASERAADRRRRTDPDARRIVEYTVRPGDTPSELAVRFHAWTDELIAMNGRVLHVGERIRIPVVVAAAARDRGGRERERTRSSASGRTSPRIGKDPDRAVVRRLITRQARLRGVDPQLALAVSWQEAGWQMHHTSSAGAIGAMQVLPGTGRWVSQLLGRRLHLRDPRDNITAGVYLLRVLLDAAPRRVAVAGYYQGLAGVREHGMYTDTKRYVAHVLALKRQFERGNYPA